MPYVDELFLIGRILFGGYFLRSAYAHFAHHGMLTGYTQSKGVPAPGLAVAGSGVLLLIGGLGVLLGAYVVWALSALIIFLVPVTFMMHAYWKVADPGAKMGDQVNFWKNLALVGAILMMLALPMPWMYALR
jgi:uncharacterized membrane protein YphA (DoxX/SURF4 family)